MGSFSRATPLQDGRVEKRFYRDHDRAHLRVDQFPRPTDKYVSLNA